MSRNKVKVNGYMSLSKLAWNEACRKVNEIELARSSFKIMIHKIEYSLDMTGSKLHESLFCKCFNESFVGTVLSGRYMASNFNDCRLGFDMIRKIARYYNITCRQMKRQYRLASRR